MDWSNNNGMDVSSFLLVEDSADSEIDSLCINNDAIDDDDDAESRSCESQDSFIIVDGDFESDDSAGDGYSMWLSDVASGYVSTEEGEEENWIGKGLSKEVIDAMDDRIFWETCLAIGYP